VDFSHLARAHARYWPRAHSARGAGQPGGRLGGGGACAGGGGGGGGRVRFIYHTAGFLPRADEVSSVGPGVTLTELLARASAEQPGDGVRPDGRPAPMPAVARMRGGWSTRHVLLLFGLCFGTGGDCMPLSAQQASLPSIYDGLPAALPLRLGAYPPHRRPAPGRQVGRRRPAHDKTRLVYGSFEWGVRVWMQSQMVVDPLMGVLFWASLMQAIKVLLVPGEPRRAVPHETIEAIIDLVEARYLHDLFAVFLILVLYYSFSRTECACPKTYTGRECFDEDVHWGVREHSTVCPMASYTLHPTPYTLHPTPSYTLLHPTPYTLLHPPPSTLHPTPYTLHPTYTLLHPARYTLHPTPYTLHPTPYMHPTP
jgi:hypothetical protein